MSNCSKYPFNLVKQLRLTLKMGKLMKVTMKSQLLNHNQSPKLWNHQKSKKLKLPFQSEKVNVKEIMVLTPNMVVVDTSHKRKVKIMINDYFFIELKFIVVVLLIQITLLKQLKLKSPTF